MKENDYDNLRRDQLRLARETEELAEEVKLLAINLAITLAKTQSHDRLIKDMEPQFSELVKRANESSHQVSTILKGIRNQKKMFTEDGDTDGSEPRRSGYEKMEASLKYVNDLSQNIIKTITRLRKQQVG